MRLLHTMTAALRVDEQDSGDVSLQLEPHRDPYIKFQLAVLMCKIKLLHQNLYQCSFLIFFL